MSQAQLVEKLLNDGNGTLFAYSAVRKGLPRNELSRMVRLGELERVRQVTCAPASSSCGNRWRPTKPVAPVSNTLTPAMCVVLALFVLWGVWLPVWPFAWLPVLLAVWSGAVLFANSEDIFMAVP